MANNLFVGKGFVKRNMSITDELKLRINRDAS